MRKGLAYTTGMYVTALSPNVLAQIHGSTPLAVVGVVGVALPGCDTGVHKRM